MKPLDPRIIAYFQKNELNLLQFVIDNSVTYNTFPQPRQGHTLYKIEGIEDNLVFEMSDFKLWRRYKDYYNSPLYKAMNELTEEA